MNVAAGDFDGDDTAEIVAAMASNGGRVEIRAGDGTLINGFEAFDSTQGVLVAVGDVTENGPANIIVASEVNGTEIRFFDADGVQLDSFQVNGNIISLAVGRMLDEFGNSVTLGDENGNPSTTDDSLTITITDEPPPTAGTVDGAHNYDNKTLTDGVIGPESNIYNVKVAGDTSNEGVVSNATVLHDATLTGGKLTGYVENQGTITDVEFVGAELKGGSVGDMIVTAQDGLGILINVTILVNATVKYATVSGDIDNQGTLVDVTVEADATVTGGTAQGAVQNQGTLKDVFLAAGTQVEGGTLSDKVAGDADDKALIKDAYIAEGSELSDVIIDEGTELADNVDIGDGVRFVSDEVIPEGADLTAAISKEFAETLPPAVDMGTDVVTDKGAPNLLEQVNDVPYLKENDWQLTQDPETGELKLTVGDISYAVIPVRLQQAKEPHAGFTPNLDGSINFVTAKGRDIQGHPAVQNIPALGKALVELDMDELVLQKNGVVSAQFQDGKKVAARADIAAYLVSDDEPLGLFPTEDGFVRLVFVDDEDQKREQFLYPFCAYPEALYDYQANLPENSTELETNEGSANEPDGAEPANEPDDAEPANEPELANELELAYDGTVAFTIEGEHYLGVFDYMVYPSENDEQPENAQLEFTPIMEEGEIVGFTVTYSTGESQIVWLIG